MKNLLLLLFTPFYLFSQDYTFNGTMSEEILENYLDRAISMTKLSSIQGHVPSEEERLEDIEMLHNINAKFVGRLGHWWASGWSNDNLNEIFDKFEQNVIDIKAGDSDIICQAAVFEIVTLAVQNFWIDEYVWLEFGYELDEIPDNHRLNYEDMLYTDGRYVNHWGTNQSIPDITKEATQMWFYFMATEFISRGAEAMHFGQVHLMSEEDTGNEIYWSLLNRVREFGSSRNRGVVICDAHGQFFLNDSEQLLFDFHGAPLRIRNVLPFWNSDNGGAAIIDCDYNGSIYGKSKGGISPLGWETSSQPSLVEFDNYGITDHPNNMNKWYPWGWDEITWFGLQNEDYRNDWLVYAYHKIKCLDEKIHLAMPGRRGMVEENIPWPGRLYRAKMGIGSQYFNQENTIRDIWNGTFDSPLTWPTFDFSPNVSYEKVSIEPCKREIDVKLTHDFCNATNFITSIEIFDRWNQVFIPNFEYNNSVISVEYSEFSNANKMKIDFEDQCGFLLSSIEIDIPVCDECCPEGFTYNGADCFSGITTKNLEGSTDNSGRFYTNINCTDYPQNNCCPEEFQREMDKCYYKSPEIGHNYFIWNNTFYSDLNCEKNCCPEGFNYNGTTCEIDYIFRGVIGFIEDGNFYTSQNCRFYKTNDCCPPHTTYDGVGCYYSSVPKGHEGIIANTFHTNTNCKKCCPEGFTFDGENCSSDISFVGVNVIHHDGKFYTTQNFPLYKGNFGCPPGTTFDGFGCLHSDVPEGYEGSAYNNTFYTNATDCFDYYNDHGRYQNTSFLEKESISSKKVNSTIKIFPNPTNNYININLGKNYGSIKNIEIHSISGDYYLKIEKDKLRQNVQIGNLPNSGLYLIRITSLEKTEIFKVLKLRNE